MILLAALHIAGSLTYLAFLADQYECRNILQLPLWCLTAACWPVFAAIRLAHVAHREYLQCLSIG